MARYSQAEKRFLKILDAGKLPSNWRETEDAGFSLGCFIQSMKDGILPFMIATRFQYRSWPDIDACRADVISIVNDSKTVWELFELFLFDKIRRNSLNFKFDKMIVNDIVREQITNQIADVVGKYSNRWTKPVIFDALSALVSEHDKKKLGAVDTSLDLVKEMLEHIPSESFKGTVLDPVCGRGIFLWQAKQIMMEQDLTEQQALNKITGIDINLKKCYIASALLNPTAPYNSKISVGDSLAGDWKMKFDIIVGNPPFQAVTTSDKEKQGGLWHSFLTKSVEKLCKDDGIVALITPKGWASIGNYSRDSYKLNLFKSVSMILVNVSDKLPNYFKGIGSSFSYYILRKNSNTKRLTKIIGYDDIEFEIDFKTIKVFPFDYASELSLSILDKTITSDEYDFIEGKNKNTDNKKIYLIAGRFVRADQIKFDSIGKTQDSYKCSMSLSDSECVGSVVFQTKLFRFIFKCLGGESGQNGTGIMKKLPNVDLTRSWTDKQLYNYFNLTQDEINLIEKLIK